MIRKCFFLRITDYMIVFPMKQSDDWHAIRYIYNGITTCWIEPALCINQYSIWWSVHSLCYISYNKQYDLSFLYFSKIHKESCTKQTSLPMCTNITMWFVVHIICFVKFRLYPRCVYLSTLVCSSNRWQDFNSTTHLSYTIVATIPILDVSLSNNGGLITSFTSKLFSAWFTPFHMSRWNLK